MARARATWAALCLLTVCGATVETGEAAGSTVVSALDGSVSVSIDSDQGTITTITVGNKKGADTANTVFNVAGLANIEGARYRSMFY